MLVLVTVPPLRGQLTYHLPQYDVALDHLPGRGSDAGYPTYVHSGRPTVYLDSAALRRGGAVLPADTTYAVVAAGGANTRLAVQDGARLFFAPALEVRAPRLAGWILTYRASAPARAVPARRYRLGGGFVLTRVRGWRASS